MEEFSLDHNPGDDKSFVIIELFSSEGCSSCPPAEAFVNALVREARTKGLPIYPLALHVDYWNRLNYRNMGVWHDPYSSPQHSLRQKAYGYQLTPQLIVNGTHLARGQGQLGPAFFRQQLAIPRQTSLTLSLADGQRLRYAVDDAPAGTHLHFALVQRHVVQEVPRGENSGETLEHENIVRAFMTVPMPSQGTGTVPVTVPDGVDPADCSVIGFVQHRLPTVENLTRVLAAVWSI